MAYLRLVGLLDHLQGLDFTLTLLTVHSLVEPLVLIVLKLCSGRLFIGPFRFSSCAATTFLNMIFEVVFATVHRATDATFQIDEIVHTRTV
jgi:hypothetical protein